MDIAEKLKELNQELSKHLESLTLDVVADLENIENEGLIRYYNTKTFSDISAFYFEYEYDYLDIVFWAVDRQNNLVCEAVIIPTKIHQGADVWKALLPERIYDEAAIIQDNMKDEDEDIFADYQDEKYKLFSNWFINCWDLATAKRRARVDAYFSIHDTFFRTDLNTGEKLNDDQIAERYK